ncbi:O-antigen polymerase [Shewanella vesiculosa]|uniref:O-antigen polymerase n=1 Tax=Shewanella vesiculosa TaxID=518738 RepID=UPI00384B8669
MLKILIASISALFFLVAFIFIDYGVDIYLISISHFVYLYIYYEAIKISLKNGHYISIDIVFYLFFYVILLFPYALYLFDIFDLVSARYVDYVFIDYSNQAIAISMFGVCAYFIGSTYQLIKLKPNLTSIINAKDPYVYDGLIKVVLLLQLLFFVLFMLTGYSNLSQGSYGGTDTGTNAENGVYFLVTHFCLMGVGLCISNMALKKRFTIFHFSSISLVLFWMLLLLSFGDRNMFFILAVSIFAGYVIFIRKVPFKLVLINVAFALFLYQIVEYTRMAEELTFERMLESYMYYKTIGDESQIGSGSFYNTTISLRASLEFAENNDYFWGKFKIVGILGIIPFSRSLFISPDDPYVISADVLTETVLGPAATWGIGTNIISDIYLDFGPIGVFILMYILGSFSGYLSRKVSYGFKDPKLVTIFIIVVSLYSQIARYTFDFPVRNIAWTLIIFIFYGFIMKKYKSGAK